jgi:large subunit ribosomal protein L28
MFGAPVPGDCHGRGVGQLTGKRAQAGNNRSHANNKSKRRWRPNLQWKRTCVPELGRSVRLRISASAIRTLIRKGLMQFLKDEGLALREVT